MHFQDAHADTFCALLYQQTGAFPVQGFPHREPRIIHHVTSVLLPLCPRNPLANLGLRPAAGSPARARSPPHACPGCEPADRVPPRRTRQPGRQTQTGQAGVSRAGLPRPHLRPAAALRQALPHGATHRAPGAATGQRGIPAIALRRPGAGSAALPLPHRALQPRLEALPPGNLGIPGRL